MTVSATHDARQAATAASAAVPPSSRISIPAATVAGCPAATAVGSIRVEATPQAASCAGASLAVRRPAEQYENTGRRLECRERREAAPEAGFAGREALPASVRGATLLPTEISAGR